MSQPGAKPVVLGFMSVREADGGLRGGYLLTTEYGRPIEFHYTTALNISRQQRVLYGKEFEPYVYAEVLGKPMTDRQGTAPRIVAVDHPALLELRRMIPAPVVRPLPRSKSEPNAPMQVEVNPQFAADRQAFEKLYAMTPPGLDWLEPFERLEQAIAEVRDPANHLVA